VGSRREIVELAVCPKRIREQVGQGGASSSQSAMIVPNSSRQWPASSTWKRCFSVVCARLQTGQSCLYVGRLGTPSASNFGVMPPWSTYLEGESAHRLAGKIPWSYRAARARLTHYGEGSTPAVGLPLRALRARRGSARQRRRTTCLSEMQESILNRPRKA
jgi:hypothetical protein